MTVHLRSKGHILTPALKEIRRTRVESLFQWQAENGLENILFKNKKFFTIEDKYNNQNNNICAQTSLEEHSENAGMPPPLLRRGLLGGVPSGSDTSSFLQERGETGVRVYQEDVLQGVVKQLNMTSSVVRNGSSSRTQFLPKSQEDTGVAAEEPSGPY
jgi:hypothetical protein